MCELGLEDKPNKCDCCLKLDQTSPSSCLQMLGVTGFVLCGRYKAANWYNCKFPYGKAPCLKRASKRKDKKNSEPCGRKRKQLFGADLASGDQLGWATVLHQLRILFQIPSPYSQLLIPGFLQAALFVCYHPHTFLKVLWLLCSFSALHGSFLLWAEKDLDAHVKSEVLTHHGFRWKERWVSKKKEMWERIA